MLQNVKANWDESDSTLDSYILNKPVIPVQKNADWDESDSSDAGYIKNKPSFEIYMPVTSNALSAGGKYLIDSTALNTYNNYFTLQNMDTDGAEIDFAIKIDRSEQYGVSFFVGDFHFGKNQGVKNPPFGVYYYKIKHEIKNDVGYNVLLNKDGGIIAYNNNVADNLINKIYFNENGAKDSYSAIPLSNEYLGYPFGGYVTPIDNGNCVAGIEFNSSCTGVELNFGDNQYQNKYLHAFSRTPVIQLFSGNTVNNFLFALLPSVPLHITVRGDSSSHFYLSSGTNDWLYNQSNNQVSFWTWMESKSDSSFTRFFVRDSDGAVATKNDIMNLPKQNG